MTDIDILDVKAGLEEENEGYARQVRAFLAEKGVRFINLMASPGAGKTTLLCRVIDALKERFSIGVIEADVDSDVDARTVQAHGAKVVQLHTGGSCHMDARMTLAGLKALCGEAASAGSSADAATAGSSADAASSGCPDIVFLENIGNLVCPAEFDTGAQLKLVILSTPEGDDKPLKYPLMFTVADIVLVSKMDVAEVFDFSLERFEKNLRMVNTKAQIFPLSAKTGEGVHPFISWLKASLVTY